MWHGLWYRHGKWQIVFFYHNRYDMVDLGSSPSTDESATMSEVHHPNTERVAIDAAGRLVVPARFRRAMGLRGRGTVVVGMVGDSLHVHTVDGALERLQRLARRKKADDGSAVDAFIAERRDEAERE